MRSRIVLILALLALAVPGAACGQAAEVQPGRRLRVWTENAPEQRPRFERTTGTLSSLTDETLFLNVGDQGQVWQISRPSIARMDVAHARPRSAAAFRSAGIGLLAGLATGAAMGFALGSDTDGFPALTAGQKAMMLGVGLAVPSAIVGAVIGASRPGESWERIPLQVAP
jgi:hypothetical protein